MLNALAGVAHVLRRGHRQQAEADGVGSVLVDLRDRVNAGPQRLAHPPPVRGLNNGVNVNVAEGTVAGETEPHHHHSRDPEEENVARRREHIGGIKSLVFRRFVGPAERCEGPQR